MQMRKDKMVCDTNKDKRVLDVSITTYVADDGHSQTFDFTLYFNAKHKQFFSDHNNFYGEIFATNDLAKDWVIARVPIEERTSVWKDIHAATGVTLDRFLA